MHYVNLGATGLRVSRICLGMMSFGNNSERPWVLDESQAEPIIRAAVEGGVTFFDTADTYSKGASEEATGRILPKLLSRDEMVVATKVFMPMTPGENGGGLSRKHILSAIDASLARLDMDYVDLYQIHRWDPRTPIEETMEALHDVVRSGKARYIGASSMFAWQFAKAQHVAEQNHWTPFVSMQPHYNLIYREEEREMIPLCLDQGVGVIPWSPLARGVLAGNRSRDGDRRTTRSDTDDFTNYLYAQPTDFDVVDRVGGGGRRPRGPIGPGGPGLAARTSGSDGPHRRCHQAAPPGRRAGRRGAAAVRRRGGPARRAVRPPSRPRPLLNLLGGESSARRSGRLRARTSGRGALGQEDRPGRQRRRGGPGAGHQCRQGGDAGEHGTRDRERRGHLAGMAAVAAHGHEDGGAHGQAEGGAEAAAHVEEARGEARLVGRDRRHDPGVVGRVEQSEAGTHGGEQGHEDPTRPVARRTGRSSPTAASPMPAAAGTRTPTRSAMRPDHGATSPRATGMAMSSRPVRTVLAPRERSK